MTNGNSVSHCCIQTFKMTTIEVNRWKQDDIHIYGEINCRNYAFDTFLSVLNNTQLHNSTIVERNMKQIPVTC